ncbi:MAG: PorT family protein [Bacteroidales bacterium]|nr:PorT family protein [Bacteroidales bacterium]
MKKLRSLALSVMALAATLSASAQFRYGPKIGANFTDMTFKQTIVGTSSTTNPAAGLECEFIFTNFGLGIDFGIGYSATGGKVNLGEKPIWGLQGYGNERVMIHNLHIPLHLRFKWTKLQGFEDYLAPFIYGGPDFNIQVGHSSHNRAGSSAFKFSGGDVALSCGFGLEIMRNWQASFGYSWAVTYSLRTSLLENYSARMRGWNVKIAYLF